ncbi:antifreeze protein type I [Paenibacillus agaridevorans]|uniref:Antifreeze protein type I n=1 Tax=Paenibacillus agaridevorans TaxID=171404 RepID=A0A2R5ESM6_9BACL|nr:SPFH domain-containing protein [Paenibacillus agaridevorans]GBG09135.1 antifreeze protein type I [Paenibacillus agaridevorans]
MALIDVVKYDGPSDVYAWKFPDQELGTWTQLIVNQSQEAILFKGGKALDSFGPGRHTLSTANIPILNHVINLPFGGKSPFTAEVWYVNKASSIDIKWGTSTPLQIKDPKYNIIVPVRAFGQFGLTIEDSRKFLLKLVGTMREFNREELSRHLRGVVMMNITGILTSYLIQKGISTLEINAFVRDLSTHVEHEIAVELQDFGIKVHNFYFENINVPEDDPSISQLRKVLNKRLEMDVVGYSYQQDRSLSILEGAANNSGGMQPLFMSARIGDSLGNAFGPQMTQVAGAMDVAPPGISCSGCHTTNMQGAMFCSGCGKSLTAPATPPPLTVLPHNCDKCGKPLVAGAKFCAHCGDRYHACPSCGADTPEGSSHCRECGTSLPKPCVSCKETIDGGARFCNHCGAAQTQGG